MGNLRRFFGLALQTTLAFSLPDKTATCDRPRSQLLYGITWVPEPPGRGSLSIFASCVATFIFCVWTTVHPNIIPGTRMRFKLLYKFWQTVLAVLVPEGILLFAFGQWVEARALDKEWRKHFKNPEDAKYLGRDGAFFVLMGGFAVRDTSECYCGASQDADKKLPILTSAGFNALVKNNLINKESFSKKEILDKGKTSNIAKLLSALQALWLLVQCVARWHGGYGVTLLELHVLIQVVLTFIIYICWWDKPLDVNEPITISLDLTEYHDHNSESKDSLDETISDPEAAILGGDHCRPKYKGDDLKNPKSRLLNQRIGDCWVAVVAKALYDVASYLNITSTFQDPSKLEDEDKANTMSSKRGVFTEGSLVMAIGIFHMAAWNSHFPTPIEKHLWRASCFGMCVCSPMVVFAMLMTNYEFYLIRALLITQNKKQSFFELIVWAIKRIYIAAKEIQQEQSLRMYLLHLFGTWVSFGLTGLYALSVIYITVESVISLRDPPSSVFCTPKFIDYWPHI